MDRMGYARGLIRYASSNAIALGASSAAMWRRVFRPRTLLYAAVLLIIALAAGISLALKNPLKVDVIRDRGALAREASPGVIENVYRLQIMNTSEHPQALRVSATGLPGIAVTGLEQPVEVGANSSRGIALRLRAPAEAAAPGVHRIEIVVEAADAQTTLRRENSTFILPRP